MRKMYLRAKVMSVCDAVSSKLRSARHSAEKTMLGLRAKIACERGQGTTEYAILWGVLVLIAIIAITIFRPKLQELWDAIAQGISGL